MPRGKQALILDKFTPIDRENWERKELFELYTEIWTATTFAASVRLDVEKLVKTQKERGEKLVPALLYVFSREVSRDMAFTVAVRDGVVGSWEKMHPMYPVLNENGTFTFHSTRVDGDYASFYSAYMEEKVRTAGRIGAFASSMPPNSYIISIIPYMDFEGFSFAMKNPKYYLAPIIEIGKYDEKYTMPASITVNHAVCDAHHISELFNRVQRALNHPEEWQ